MALLRHYKDTSESKPIMKDDTWTTCIWKFDMKSKQRTANKGYHKYL